MTTSPGPGSCSTTDIPGGITGNLRPRGSAGRAVRLAYLPAAGGVGYLVAWVAGLAAWPSNLALNATAAQTTATYAAHPAQATVQYLLVEGIAGVLLGVVLGCVLFPQLRGVPQPGGVGQLRGGSAPRAAVAALLGVVAVGTSLAQCAIGLVLISAAAGHEVARCGDLSNLVNQLDGVKMLAIAGAAVLLAALGGPDLPLPRWLRVTGLALGAALVASGCAYLALSQPLAWTAYISGTLLLVWVTGLGITWTMRQRAGREPSGALVDAV
jgi:hypothetical protein